MSAEHAAGVRAFVIRDQVSTRALLDLARREAWELINDTPRGHDYPSCRIWQLPNGVQVSLREWFTYGIRAVWVTAAPGDLDPAAERLGAAVEHDTEQGLLGELATTDDADALRRGLRALLTLPKPPVDEPRYLVAYRRALAHPARIVRRVALYVAAAYLAWPGVRELLTQRQAVETELSSQLDELLQDLAQEPPPSAG